MKTTTLLLLISLLGTPALAADYASLEAQQAALSTKIANGQATQADVAAFQSVTQQLRQLQKDDLTRIQQQNEQTRNILFGGNGGVNNSNYGVSGSAGQPNGEVAGRTTATNNISGRYSNTSVGNAPLVASISAINYQVGQLVDAALKNNQDYLAAQTAVNKYSTEIQKAMATGKDTFNYLIPYRGFAPSKEMAQVILAEEVKTNTLAAALYKEQLIIDQTHQALMTAIMETAQEIGLGQPGDGLKTLKTIVGEEQGNAIAEALKSTSFELSTTQWSVQELQEKHKLLVKAAIDQDPTVQDIVDSLHGYTKRGLASKIIMPALGAVSMVPTFAGPIARGALATYVMANGGPNESKMLKELYLGQRLESRMNLIDEEAHIALDAMQLAKATNNPTLAAAAESLMEQMASPATVRQVLQ